MENAMRERERIARQMEAIEGKFEELSIRITLPEVISDTQLFQKLMREHSEMTEIAEAAKNYGQLLRHIGEAKEMAESGDDEMAEMAKEELEELEKECIWTADIVLGYNGYRVTGPNGNSIFLPASGGRSNAQLAMENSFAGYWSGTERDSQTAYGLTIRPEKDYVSGSAYEWKYMGRLVRPVIEKY